MKALKKLLVVVMSLAMVFAMTVTAFAASELSPEEKALLDKIKAGVVVNGATVAVPDDYITQAQAYLTKNDLSATQVDILSKAVDEVVADVKASGVKSFNEMVNTPALNSKIVAVLNDANTKADLGLTITAGDNKLTISDANGKIFEDTTTKHTGSDYRTVAIAGLGIIVVLAACGIIISKKRLHNASAEA